VRTCETTVRVGKLIENDYEDPESIQEIEKVHENLETAMQYMDSLVSIKEKKGYEPLEKKINPAKARKSFEKAQKRASSPEPEVYRPYQESQPNYKIEEENNSNTFNPFKFSDKSNSNPTKMEEEIPKPLINDDEDSDDGDLTRLLRKKPKAPAAQPVQQDVKSDFNNIKFEELESSFDLDFNRYSKVYNSNGADTLKRRNHGLLEPTDTKQVRVDPQLQQQHHKASPQIETSDDLITPTKNRVSASPLTRLGSQTEYNSYSHLKERIEDLKGETSFDFDPETFKGIYLLSFKGYKLHFCKIQLLKTWVKVENGIQGDSKSQTVQYYLYKDRGVALKKAKDEIEQMISQEYGVSMKFFEYNFKENEPGLKAGLSNRMPRSLPTSPQQRVHMNSPPKREQESEKKSQNRPSFMERIQEERKEFDDDDIEDNASDALSFDLDNPYYTNFNKKKTQLKRTETRVRSVSPERNSLNRVDSIDTDAFLGEPVDGPYDAMQTASKFDRRDTKGWYISEKLDSVRAFWDGAYLWSKKGKKYRLPDYFCDGFPESPLDGELFMGKGNAHKLALLLQKKKPKDEEWNEVKFIVFDAPELKLPFKDRLDRLRRAFRVPLSPYITLYEYKVCGGSTDLANELDKVEKAGGEGFILRDPKGFYVKGKSSSVMDANVFHYEEADVIGHEPGKGKYENLTGGLQVQNVYGIVFTLTTGMTDAWRKNPPKIGTKISYKFKSVSDMGVPKYPSIVRSSDD